MQLGPGRWSLCFDEEQRGFLGDHLSDKTLWCSGPDGLLKEALADESGDVYISDSVSGVVEWHSELLEDLTHCSFKAEAPSLESDVDFRCFKYKRNMEGAYYFWDIRCLQEPQGSM
eukprot:13880997-Heterocapsa_arctica.AAC.2